MAAKKTQTVTEILTAAGITKTSAALEAIYTAMQLGTEGTQADLMEAAGTKDTATRVALAELVAKGLIVRTEGTGTGKNRTPNTYSLPVVKKAKKEKKTEAVSTETTIKDDARYGKAMVQILAFMKEHKDELFTVPQLMTELDRPWYNATNQALKALAARETGVTETVNDKKVRAYVYSE